ncbi:MAG: 2-C-methyl-D-erythritol 4-phosphate cytidylyltransferase [Bdellovibrionales bacterium]|nr:2-C-methyl-D-erythritol 4-phosphate cytidylyltransferase [Bdellovibrionales bacterium]
MNDVKAQRRVFGVIVAAGTGERLGANRPKALVEVGGCSMLTRVLRTFAGIRKLATLVVTVTKGFEKEFEREVATESRVGRCIFGGDTRQESVRLALGEIERTFSPQPDDIVIIHDAARCLVSVDLLEQAIEAAVDGGAVTAAIPVTDSLVSVENYMVLTTLPRADLWRVQTPQVFHFSLISEAHRKSHIGATDDAGLVRNIANVSVIPGEEMNFKITTPFDLQMANLLVGEECSSFKMEG